MRFFVLLSAILSLAFSALPVMADENTENQSPDSTLSIEQKEEKPVELNPVNVKGKKLPVYSPYATTESAKISTEVMDSEEIDKHNPVDFYDMISRGAGVNESFQGRKVMNFAGVRRGGSMGMIIDGMYIPSTQASRILAQFPMDTIESIRIVRDSTSLSVGPLKAFASYSGAPNDGFIVIKTKRGYKPQIGGSMMYGNYGTSRTQFYLGNQIGNFDFRVTGTSMESSGKTDWHNDKRYRSYLFNGGYNGSFLKINAMFFFSNGMRNFQLNDSNIETEGEIKVQHWGYDPLKGFWGSLNADALWSSSQTTSFTIGHGLVKDTEWLNSFNETTSTMTLSTREQRDEVDNYHLWHTASFGNNTLKAGGQLIRWDQPSGYASYDGNARKEDMVGAYIQDEQSLLNGRLTFDAGLRIDMVRIDKGIDKYSPSEATNMIIQNEWTEPVYGGSAGSSFRLNDIMAFNARVGYTHAEIDSYLATVNDRDLPPEERFKYELGTSMSFHPAFNPKVTVFYYDIRNSKTSVDTETATTPEGDDYTYKIYDCEDEYLYGGEISVNGIIPFGFNYKINYSYNESSIASNSASKPKHSVSGVLGYVFGPVDANVTMRYISEFNKESTTPCGDFYKIDGNINYRFKILNEISGRVRLYGRNLLDDHYTTSSRGYSDVGRTYGVEVAANTTF